MKLIRLSLVAIIMNTALFSTSLDDHVKKTRKQMVPISVDWAYGKTIQEAQQEAVDQALNNCEGDCTIDIQDTRCRKIGDDMGSFKYMCDVYYERTTD